MNAKTEWDVPTIDGEGWAKVGHSAAFDGYFFAWSGWGETAGSQRGDHPDLLSLMTKTADYIDWDAVPESTVDALAAMAGRQAYRVSHLLARKLAS
ncbi:hypothetical protein GTQ99_00110 [Kineococcus sp. T13]|uniref:hypothetical protein n=1 Tax=Kineococcus vitellinus TaxID=2696565 RepID=UPI001412CBB1|nr:hypothetical protein [Kineococcus vitellinus]NAZ73833.1 hypothetical protein [Kineococcus vitellinus]